MNEKSVGTVRRRALMSLWQLIRLVDEDADGMITGSPYATAGVVARLWQTPRLLPVSLARLGLNALARSRNGDGSWGSPHAPRPYRVVPTLAVVCALAGLPADAPIEREWVRGAARRGSGFLFEDPEVFVPDRLPSLEAVDRTVPVLLEQLAQSPEFDAEQYGPALLRARMAQRANADRCARLRARAAAGDRAAWRVELLATAPGGWRSETAVRGGAVACSPVLTAAAVRWHGAELAGIERYLRREGVRRQGLWPPLAPAVNHERAMAAALFVRLGFPLPPGFTASLSASLRSALGADGMSFAPGLPPDAEHTALAIFVLNSWDDAVDSRCLLDFPAPATPLATAHVLEAWTTVAAMAGTGAVRDRATAAVRALIETQDPDGHWDDRTVASACLPTAVAAMARVMESEFSADALLAVSRAIGWLLANQRSDGSWGVWHPGTEETAYAVHALGICASPAVERLVAAALRRAHIFLTDSFDSAMTDSVRTPLWHYKDLAAPLRIERLYTLTALLMSGSPVP
ncbi:prenyltransferase/squalene oxidase repeat-containing protein [Nocardia seriolae]|uniref:prenyltransferase/squalene oxidase repeat-containing protein n=1 Tax=Nocardia seriolae TaxID=37332 RepID=UPI00091B0553|nr:prenyltransferase/squalene oxidase repeat-containing protein [Nocardia seriolae]OJF80362.1 hypothetical protein NS14008_15560 [Nocardia seriolae]QOW35688.1 terpene cyclase/mutase family protein [Nocardia seriolae]QUN16824.1 terpene cyclase/mutase family protein [Nocardia seriolae]WNJ56074.1 terpene cyclase/mutase family protein [Nocardia seriolae]